MGISRGRWVESRRCVPDPNPVRTCWILKPVLRQLGCSDLHCDGMDLSSPIGAAMDLPRVERKVSPCLGTTVACNLSWTQ